VFQPSFREDSIRAMAALVCSQSIVFGVIGTFKTLIGDGLDGPGESITE
jgi:hypothetical protein